MGYKKGGTAFITLDYSPEIDAVNAQLSDQDAQSATLLHGLSAITTDQATPTSVRIFGRTLVNLLGKDGNFENDSNGDGVADGWNKGNTNGSFSLSSISPKYGNNSQRITALSGDTLTSRYVTPFAPIKIKAGKFYIFLVDFNNDGSQNGRLFFEGNSKESTVPKLLYVKANPSSDKDAELYLYNFGVLGSTGWVQFDGARLLEIPQSIYDKIDVDPAYTGDALAAKFPYVDSVQHVMNPYVKNSGKNLIPPFTNGKWALHANAKVISDYELELDATGASQTSTVVIPCVSGQAYMLSYNANSSSGKIEIWDNESNIFIASLYGGGSLKLTATSNTFMVKFYNGNSTTSGTFTFTNPQLELGTTPTPFEPQNESYLYVAQDTDKNPILLASNNDGSVADEVYQRDNQWYRLNRFVRNMVLDGSLGWSFDSDQTGFKVVKVPKIASSYLDNSTSFSVKYDGKILAAYTSVASSPDGYRQLTTDSSTFLTVSDTDSGWGESYTPSASEIKAYFFGWKMNNGTFGTAYAGTGTKTWVPIGDTDNTRATTVLPTADAPTIAEGKIDHYKLTYQLAQATEEAIEVEGSLDLINGGNQIEVGEAVIVMEKANPYYNSTYDKYYINDPIYGNGVHTKYKTTDYIQVFKDGNPDNKWGFGGAINSLGRSAFIPASDYDPDAEYTVTYIALDTYKLSSAENNVEITYNTNIKTVVDELVKRQEDDETDISALKLQMIDAIARLQAGGL